MLKPEETRRLEVKQGDQWVVCADQGALEPGDVFRMFEPDGAPVAGGNEYRVGKHPAIYCDQVSVGDDGYLTATLRSGAKAAPTAAPAEADAAAHESFQARVGRWMTACFGQTIPFDKVERGDRLLEEVLELLQSGGYDPARVVALRDYVWGRPVGDPPQEVGGVAVTLAAYCNAFGLDIEAAAANELARIWTKVDAIRAKQAAKPTGSALPIAVDASLATGAAAEIRGGRIEVSVDIDALPAIVSGSCCADGLDGFWKVTEAEVFAREVCRALNHEDEIGTTLVHRMFDGAFREALEQGSEGIEECSEKEFEEIAASFMAKPLEDPGRPVPPHGSGP